MPTTVPPKLPPVIDELDAVDGASDRTPRREPSAQRRSTRRRELEGRRLTSAGHAFVLALLALVLGMVLNAPGVHKRAYNQPEGWKRDVAIAITGPLATVSETLYLDSPRVALQAAIGRSGEDEIDTDLGIDVGVASPPTTPVKTPTPGGSGGTPATPVTPKPTTPKKQSFTPAKPLKLWVAGDSLVITPGFAVLRAASANRAIDPVGTVEGRVATGLARPDVFNWFKEIRSQLASLKPKAVVLAFGGNDDKAYMTGLPEGVSIGSFGDAAWTQEYRRRVGALFDLIRRAGAHTVWIGLPQTRDASQTARFEVVNAAVVAEARERPRSVSYIDTYILFAGSDGGFAQYLSVPGRGQLKVRADDGVHFERDGGDLVADEVVKALRQAYDITSWKTGSDTS